MNLEALHLSTSHWGPSPLISFRRRVVVRLRLLSWLPWHHACKKQARKSCWCWSDPVATSHSRIRPWFIAWDGVMWRNEQDSHLREAYPFSRTKLHKQEFRVKKCKISCQCTTHFWWLPHGSIWADHIWGSVCCINTSAGSESSVISFSSSTGVSLLISSRRLHRTLMKQIRLQKEAKRPGCRLECDLTRCRAKY